MRLAPLTATLGLALALPGLALADPLQPGSYELHNHADGNQASPFYGLRLDGVNGNNADEVTFDFDAPGADMNMHLSASGLLTISGTAFGGIDVGSTYDPNWSGLWDINMTYQLGVVTRNGRQVWEAQQDNALHTGTVVSQGAIDGEQRSYQIWDKSNGRYSFRIDTGHRGEAGYSGWGWVTHSTGGQGNYVGASDWLFTIKPVPEPGTWALIVLGGLALMGGARRRA